MAVEHCQIGQNGGLAGPGPRGGAGTGVRSAGVGQNETRTPKLRLRPSSGAAFLMNEVCA